MPMDGEIWQPMSILADSIRYNAVATSELPVDSSIIQIDTVRLPQDGKVPIFRTGDMILIGNRINTEIGSAFTGGQVVRLPRQNLDRICVKDSNGKPLDANLYDDDLEAGTVSFKSPLDLSGYKLPLVAMHAVEEKNRVANTDIDGTLTLMFPLRNSYEVENTYVSSILTASTPNSTLQVRSSIPFTQKNWNGKWTNEPVGDPLLNRLNVKDYPIILTDDGAINERWLIKFTSSSQFELYGETLGFVMRTDILQEPLISVMIDDVLFVILAEEVAHHRQFVGNTVSLSGRNVTAHLSKEYATANPLPSGNLYASQIVNVQLENTGITANFNLTDWQIGEQIYSVTGKTPIGVLDDIAKAVGGFVGSHHHLPALTLAPVYKVGAWELATATPDRIIPLSVIHKMSLTTNKAPRYNTVTLVGQTGGIVYRQNEGQDKDFGVIDNTLLNDESIATRGVYELSKTGVHTQITVQIRLSSKHGLGLANLGEIWQINDEVNGNLSPFKGVVTAIQIDVKSEKGIPQIWQVVTIDRYDDV